jgi:hypothetical protein
VDTLHFAMHLVGSSDWRISTDVEAGEYKAEQGPLTANSCGYQSLCIVNRFTEAKELNLLMMISLWAWTLLPFAAGTSADEKVHRTSIGQWRDAAPMAETREYAGGVRLKDGRILAVSGHPLNGKSIASAELYDPATGAWSATGSLRQPRNGGNSAVLLHDGRVLIAGGNTNTEALRGAEIYDPATGRWSDAGNLGTARIPVATVLKDGRVLVSGGIDWNIDGGKAYSLAELFDPHTGKWAFTGSLGTGRYAHQVVLLDDGRVLAVGGYQSGDVLLAGTEIYSPELGRWEGTQDLPSSRIAFGMVKLNDGRVLVVGGFTGRTWKERSNVADAALFDPKTGRWSLTKPMKVKRAGASITLLPNGQVLVAGGWADNGMEYASTEVFDPLTDTWRATAPMNVARRNHNAALLPDGSVLIMGGSTRFGGVYLKSCEIFRY